MMESMDISQLCVLQEEEPNVIKSVPYKTLNFSASINISFIQVPSSE